MELNKLKERLEKFSSERNWNQFHSVKNLSMALNVEASELLEIFQWLTEEESNLIASDPVKLVEVEDEIADIFLYLIQISNKLNIDLNLAVNNKIIKNEIKYPIELAHGNSKKYTDF